MVTNEQFLAALAGDLPEDERIIVCHFLGDPDEAGIPAWRPRPWRPGKECAAGLDENVYATVASFRKASDNTWRRRGELFAAGRSLMIDDLGTKLPMDTVAPLKPSAMVETSPGNYQCWYFLAEPVTDRLRFDALIRAFIAQQLLGGVDTGMSGVTRVGRLPLGRNGKAKYGGWSVRLAEWDPERRVTAEELIRAYGLRLEGQMRPMRRVLPSDLQLRGEMFVAHFRWLQQRGMLKREKPDISGWYEMTCPWVDGHTGRADTGAALREPFEENGWYGAFRCHHGHCLQRGWQDLTDWINDNATTEKVTDDRFDW